jgi:hypothetical protein
MSNPHGDKQQQQRQARMTSSTTSGNAQSQQHRPRNRPKRFITKPQCRAPGIVAVTRV